MRRLSLLSLLLLCTSCGFSGGPDECAETFCAIDCGGMGRQLDDDGCLACACNTEPLSCVGLKEAACLAQPNCAPNYWDLGPSFGLPKYFGCHEKQSTTCHALACRMDCPGGLQKDANGCDTCACNPMPIDPPCDSYCEYGMAKDAAGRELCACNPGPVCPDLLCDMECDYGKARDSNGCEMCMCNPSPACPSLLCDLQCDYGKAHDSSGCEVCACNTSPPVCRGMACENYCPYGHQVDSDGCETCACATLDGGVN